MLTMPPDANIPEKWVDEADGKKIITVPSWSAEGGIYKVEMDKTTREIRCNCPGFQFRNDCHHVSYLINFCHKPQNPHKIGVQQTSLEAYRYNVLQRMGEHQAAVWGIIAEYGPISNYDIAQKLGWPINSVTPRNLELRIMERVKFAGARTNPMTGRREMLWEATE